MNHRHLERELGLPGAIITGLGSILGTGAFVSIGLASAQWGDAVLVAIPVAGVVAVFNGLSSAYLAGRFPVAGGTYEFAYETLGPRAGFTAGWLFLLAKTASAASAALGISLYLSAENSRLVAILATILITALVASGLRRTTAINFVLVSVTVLALLTFSLAGLSGSDSVPLASAGDETFARALAAAAFLFVAFTGYGRISTLGEEVKEPTRTIPRAVIVTLVVAVALYVAVELGGRASGGAHWGTAIAQGLTPASLVAEPFASIVRVGAITAMAGVLLNLILGLSRVWLAMGRRGDMPDRLGRLDGNRQPRGAVVVAGLTVGLICLVGDIAAAWSFSALTVLLYYGITNLAALRLDRKRWSAWAGLASCLFLSVFISAVAWLIGAVLIAIGLIWKAQRRV